MLYNYKRRNEKKRTYLVRGGRAEDDDWTILLSFLLFSICFSLISGLLFSLFLFSVLLAAWFLPFCVCLLLPPGIVLCVFSFLFSFVCFYFSLQSPFCDLCIFLFFLFLCSSPFSPVLPSRFLFFRTAPSPSLYLLDLPLCFFFFSSPLFSGTTGGETVTMVKLIGRSYSLLQFFLYSFFSLFFAFCLFLNIFPSLCFFSFLSRRCHLSVFFFVVSFSPPLSVFFSSLHCTHSVFPHTFPSLSPPFSFLSRSFFIAKTACVFYNENVQDYYCSGNGREIVAVNVPII